MMILTYDLWYETIYKQKNLEKYQSRTVAQLNFDRQTAGIKMLKKLR